MSDIKFGCPNCGQHIACDESYLGDLVTCPTCKSSVKASAPRHSSPTPPPLPQAGSIPQAENHQQKKQDPETSLLGFLWLVAVAALLLGFAGKTEADRRYGALAAIPLTIGAILGIVMVKHKQRGTPDSLPLSQNWANNARVATGSFGAIICGLIAVNIVLNVAAAKRKAGLERQVADLLVPLVISLFIGFIACGPVGWCLGFLAGKERERRDGKREDF